MSNQEPEKSSKGVLIVCIISLIVSIIAGYYVQEQRKNVQTVQSDHCQKKKTGDTKRTKKEAEITPAVSVKSTQMPFAKGKVIVIDAGHQENENRQLEPIGPGATEQTIKMAAGISGVASGKKEYEVTLAVAKKLKVQLRKQGYTVVITRNENKTNLSNRDRAQIANKAKADAYIQLHAAGSDNSTLQGAMTICPTENNPYCAQNYLKSKKLSKCIIQGVVEETECQNRHYWETDTLSEINWSRVPVTVLEMGYMSNAEEDLNIADARYQNKIVIGIANGLEKYFKN